MTDLISDDEWPALLARCAAALDLEASARAYRAFQRPRGVRSAAALLRLALWATARAACRGARRRPGPSSAGWPRGRRARR